MTWKLFARTSVPFGIVMALFGVRYGAIGAIVGLVSGLVFGLFMTAVLGEIHRVAGGTQVHAVREVVFYGPPDDAIVAAQRALKECGGTDVVASERAVTANVPVTWRSFGETMSIEILGSDSRTTRLTIRSSPRMASTLVDYGKNQANVDRVTASLQDETRRDAVA